MARNGKRKVPVLRKGSKANRGRNAGRSSSKPAPTRRARRSVPRDAADLAAATRNGDAVAVLVALPGYTAASVAQKENGVIVKFVPVAGVKVAKVFTSTAKDAPPPAPATPPEPGVAVRSVVTDPQANTDPNDFG